MSDLALIEAVKNGNSAAVRSSIESGANVNQQDDQGWTPLNFAAGKGNLEIVKLLVENGADIFKVGRDTRTPYMIALAAGRVSVAKYLRELEDAYPGEKPKRPERPYCKAYQLEELRKYPNWSESRINWKEKADSTSGTSDAGSDDDIVFIHQDFTVTKSIWHDENIIFNAVDPAWQEFCANTLKFKAPDDLDLIVANEAAEA
ncbi:MAG: ankyrin repeat domain-containing protein [Blastocatellia bacterium AA13]|nr:MAG: ankyrin repeat domain-containing protein [Blastocatellia bacterium AA13]